MSRVTCAPVIVRAVPPGVIATGQDIGVLHRDAARVLDLVLHGEPVHVPRLLGLVILRLLLLLGVLLDVGLDKLCRGGAASSSDH